MSITMVDYTCYIVSVRGEKNGCTSKDETKIEEIVNELAKAAGIEDSSTKTRTHYKPEKEIQKRMKKPSKPQVSNV